MGLFKKTAATLRLHVWTKRFSYWADALQYAGKVKEQGGASVIADNMGSWIVHSTFKEEAKPLVPIIASASQDLPKRHAPHESARQLHNQCEREGKAVNRSFRSIVARCRIYNENENHTD